MSIYGPITIDPEISITLAGITHRLQNSLQCEQLQRAMDIFLQGEKKVKLTDFNIEPPVKSMGLDPCKK